MKLAPLVTQPQTDMHLLGHSLTFELNGINVIPTYVCIMINHH